MKFLVMGMNIQGLIAAGLLAKSGHQVVVIDTPNFDYKEFHDKFKTGPISHFPLHFSKNVVKDLDLENYGLDLNTSSKENPFLTVPIYEHLRRLITIFRIIEKNRPIYREKGWRDAWNAFELGRLLSEEDPLLQQIFAKIVKMSLVDFVQDCGVSDIEAGQLIAVSLLGSKTDPTAKETAMILLQAMEQFDHESDYLIMGSLHALIRSLKEAARAQGATIITDKKIQSIKTKDQSVEGLILDDGSSLKSDYYIIDNDPILTFGDYMQGHIFSPTIQNRIKPDSNKSYAVRVKLALSSDPDFDPILPTVFAKDKEYVLQAKRDLTDEGQSRNPILSIIPVGKGSTTSLTPEGMMSLDIMAQYFEPSVSPSPNTIIDTVHSALERLDPNIKNKILHTDVISSSAFDGMSDFAGAMPLLRFFKIFSGHHGLVYDLPFDNTIVVGYGSAAPAHYHTRHAGERLAKLYS